MITSTNVGRFIKYISTTVIKFCQEAVVFPLDVTFERELEDTPGEFKKVRRTLFSR